MRVMTALSRKNQQAVFTKQEILPTNNGGGNRKVAVYNDNINAIVEIRKLTNRFHV